MQPPDNDCCRDPPLQAEQQPAVQQQPVQQKRFAPVVRAPPRGDEDDEHEELQHADLLRHSRMASLEHCTSHLVTTQKAVQKAHADHAALDGEGVLARLRRRSMFPSIPDHASEQRQQRRPSPLRVPTAVPEQAAMPTVPEHAHAEQPKAQPPQLKRKGLSRLQAPSFRPPRPPTK